VATRGSYKGIVEEITREMENRLLWHMNKFKKN
jgi:hypothetical protein